MYRYFVELSEKGISILKQISEEDYQDILPHVKKISNLEVDMKRINIVENAYNELISAYDIMVRDEQNLNEEILINYKLSAYLSAFKKFTDNWQTHITRTFGKDSDELKMFKTATAKQYDNHMAYKIMYRLRNYDQHCYGIISKITKSLGDNGERQCFILSNRDELLTSFDDWKSEEIEFLKNQEEYFEIFPLIKEFQQCIMEIQNDLLKVHMNKELYESCLKVLKMVNSFENENYINIASTEQEINLEFYKMPQKTLNFTYMNVPLCKLLIVQLLKANKRVFEIICYGTDISPRLQDVAEEQQSFEQVLCTQIINDISNNATFIKCYEKRNVFNSEIYAILINSYCSKNEAENIMNEFSEYINALCKITN